MSGEALPLFRHLVGEVYLAAPELRPTPRYSTSDGGHFADLEWLDLMTAFEPQSAPSGLSELPRVLLESSGHRVRHLNSLCKMTLLSLYELAMSHALEDSSTPTTQESEPLRCALLLFFQMELVGLNASRDFVKRLMIYACKRGDAEIVHALVQKIVAAQSMSPEDLHSIVISFTSLKKQPALVIDYLTRILVLYVFFKSTVVNISPAQLSCFSLVVLRTMLNRHQIQTFGFNLANRALKTIVWT
jgi:hypothetical protein